jgi:Methylase involved in ubiquinone/menaquinone biosynthesis
MYSRISPYYDSIFPADTDSLRFCTEALPGKQRLLDVGCGTGNKTLHFVAPGRRIVGTDADPDMIAEAARRNADPSISFEVLDMRELEPHFEPASFDGVLCLGNTLVHLTEPEALAGALGAFHRLLEPGGLCLIQILNYDRILDNAVSELPSLDTDTIRFERRYRRQGRTLLFMTDLLVKSTGERIASSTELYPLRPSELEKGLAQAGFSSTRLYGGYDGSPHTPESFATITVSRV